jgi:origin recognition complex subunit 3
MDLTSSPDVTILFRRYVESGKMINVYDWYESFSMALEDLGASEGEDDMELNDTPSKKKTKGNVTIDGTKQTDISVSRAADERKREFQARFMRAIHELEFVGFLKHTGRKADHVLKTVFDVID